MSCARAFRSQAESPDARENAPKPADRAFRVSVKSGTAPSLNGHLAQPIARRDRPRRRFWRRRRAFPTTPIAQFYGYDGVQFGIFTLMALVLGGLTPPVDRRLHFFPDRLASLTCAQLSPLSSADWRSA